MAIGDILGVDLQKEDIKKVTRLGAYKADSARPLLVELHDVDMKKQIFRKLGKMKGAPDDYKEVTICHDMTKAQLEKNKTLVIQAKNMQRTSQGNVLYRVRGPAWDRYIKTILIPPSSTNNQNNSERTNGNQTNSDNQSGGGGN